MKYTSAGTWKAAACGAPVPATDRGKRYAEKALPPPLAPAVTPIRPSAGAPAGAAAVQTVVLSPAGVAWNAKEPVGRNTYGDAERGAIVANVGVAGSGLVVVAVMYAAAVLGV